MFCVWEKGFKIWKRRFFARVSFYPQPLQANAVCKLEKATIFFLLSSSPLRRGGGAGLQAGQLRNSLTPDRAKTYFL